MSRLGFLAVGGLGDIGMNNLVIEWGGKRLLIDGGAKFPNEDNRFAELVLPDLGWLHAHRDSFAAVIVTHGHEDHIGALPFILPRLQRSDGSAVPTYASRFSWGLARRKLEEHGVHNTDHRVLEVSGAGSPYFRLPELPEIGLRAIRVTHSIPDATALALETPVGRVVHTGDFKIDEEPVDGEHFDRASLSALGDEGVALLLSDSTNAQVPGRTASEAAVVRELETYLDRSGRVLVCQFASNLHRLIGLEAAARRHGRRLCLLGRSLGSVVSVARAAGLATIDEGRLIAPEALSSVPPREALVVLTGSQGERRAALARVAAGEHPDLSVGPGDIVLMSSRVIPGNERPIFAMQNALRRRGATVIHGKAAPIHTSGHARQDELREMLALVRPRAFVPVHGEYGFLADHAGLATAAGVTRTLVVEDGEGFSLGADGDLRREQLVNLESHYVDGSVVGRAGDFGFDDRRRLFHSGMVSVLVEATRGGSALSADVDVQCLGVFTNGGALLDTVADEVARAVVALRRDASDADVEAVVETVVRRTFRRETGKKPVVVPFIRWRAS